MHFGPPSELFIGDSHSRSGGWWFVGFGDMGGANDSKGAVIWSKEHTHPSLLPPSKQSISVVLQGKHIYWLVTGCQCGSSGPVAEGISLGRGQGENGGN